MCSEWFLLGRAGVETCTVQEGAGLEIAAGTSGMCLGQCLRGMLGGGVNSCALKCHLGTLKNEGQFTSRVSGFYHCWKKNSTYGIPVPLKVGSLKVIS